MEELALAFEEIPVAGWWAIGVFTVLVLAAQVAALVDLARRRKVLWDRKWVWVLIILLLNNALGVILWFVLGRRVPQGEPDETAQAPTDSAKAQRAVDVVYGDSESVNTP